MSSVDNRIVEMTFDNAQFERGVATTMDTLKSLKKALDFKGVNVDTSKIMGSIGSLNFNGINSAVDAVTKKFSVWGTVADQVVRNIGNGIYSLGKTLIGSIITPLTSGGWNRAMNIEQARFQIKGLGKDFNALSEDINYAVDGTAYTFDAAAKVAAQLAASGIDAGDGMKVALRAISGVAAMTNSEYSDIGSIFTTVAGNGKVMTEQLRQLSFRGMNASAILAKQLGKSESEVNEMASKGEIDFNTFAKAMDDAFGEHAKAANETFSGSMANVRASLSKIGQMFSAPIIQQMPDVFNAIRENINQIKSQLTDVIGDNSDYNAGIKSIIKSTAEWIKLGDFSWFSNVIDAAKQSLSNFKQVLDAIQTGWDRVFGSEGDVLGSVLTKISEGFLTLTRSMSLNEKTSYRLSYIFSHLFEGAKGIFSLFSNLDFSFVQNGIAGVVNILAAFKQVLVAVSVGWNRIFGDRTDVVSDTLAHLAAMFESFTKALYLNDDEMYRAGYLFTYLFGAIDMVWSYVKNMDFRFVNDIVASIINLLALAKRIIDQFGMALNDVFGGTGNILQYFLNNVSAGLKTFTEQLREVVPLTSHDLADAFSAVLRVIKDLASIVSTVLISAFNLLVPIVTSVLRVLISLAGIIGKTVNKSLEAFDKVGDDLSHTLINLTKAVGTGIGNGITGAFNALRPVLERVSDVVIIVFQNVGKLAGVFSGAFRRSIENAVDICGKLAGIVGNGLLTAVNIIVGLFITLTDILGNVFIAVNNTIDPVGKLGAAFEAIGNFIQPAIDWISDFLGKIDDVAGKIAEITGNSALDYGEKLDSTIHVVGESLGISDEKLSTFIDNLNKGASTITRFVDNGKAKFNDFKDVVSNAFSNIDMTPFLNTLERIGDKTKEIFSKFDIKSIAGKVADGAKKLGAGAAGAFGTVKGLFDGFDTNNWGASLRNVGSKIKDLFVTNIAPAFKGGFDGVVQRVTEFGIDFGRNINDLWGNSITPMISDGVHGFIDKVSSLFSVDTVNAIKDAMSKVKDALVYAANWITGGEFGKVADRMFGNTEKQLENSSQKTFEDWDVDSTFEPIRDKIKAFGNKMLDVAQWLNTITERINKAFQEFIYGSGFEGFIGFINNVKNDIMMLNLDYFLIGISKTINRASDIMKSFSKMLKGIGKAFSGIGRAATWVGGATALLEMAISLKIAISALNDALEFYDNTVGQGDWGRFWASIAVVAAIFAALFLMLRILARETNTAQSDADVLKEGWKGITKQITGTLTSIKNAFLDIGQGGKLAGLGLSILGIAAALRVIVSALVVVGQLPWQQAVQGGIVVSAVLVGIWAMVRAISKMGKDFAKFGVGVLAVGVGLKLMISAIKDIVGMFQGTDWGTIAAASFYAVVLIGVLEAMNVIMVKFTALGKSGSAGSMIAASVSIAILSGALVILTEAIRNMTKMNGNSMKDSVIGLIGILASLAAVMVVMSKFTNAKTAVAGAAGIALIIYTLKLLVQGLSTLAYMPTQSIVASMVGIVAILVSLAVVMNQMKSMSWQQAIAGGVGIAAVVASLAFLVQSLQGLVGLPVGGILTSMLGLTAILAALALVVNQVAKTSSWQQAIAGLAGVALVVASLALLANQLANLASLDIGNVVGVVLSFCAILVVIAGALKLLATDSVDAAIAAGSIAIVCVGLLALSAAISSLAALDGQSVATSTLALVAAIGVLALVLAALGAVGPLVAVAAVSLLAASAALLIAAAAIRVLTPALEEFNNISQDAVSNFGSTMGALALGLALMIVALPGAAALLVAAAALNVLAPALQPYASATGVADNLKDILIGLAIGLTAMIVALPGAMALDKVSSGLVSLAVVLPLYGSGMASTAAQGIYEILSAISQSVGNLSGVLSGFSSGGITQLVDTLIQLAGVLPLYMDVGSAPENIGRVMNSIVDSCGGLDGLFSAGGASSVTIAAQGLETIAQSLQYYMDVGSAPENIGRVCSAIVDGCSGIKGLFSGGGAESVTTAADGLATIATKLTYYQDVGSAPENITRVCESIKNGLSGMSGVAEQAASLHTAADGLSSMAPVLHNYQDIDSGAVATAITNIGNAVRTYNDINGANLTTAASGISNLGTSLTNFPTDTSSISTGLDSMQSSLSNFSTNSLGDLTTISDDFKQFGIDIGGALDGVDLSGDGADIMGSLAGGITGNQYQVTDAMGDSFDNIPTGSATNAATNLATSFTGTIGGYSGVAKANGSQVANSASQGLSSNSGEAFKAGHTLGNNFTMALLDTKALTTVAGNAIAKAAVQAIQNQVGQFQQAGTQSGSRYAQGIRGATWAAQTAGAALANAAKRGLQGSTGSLYSTGQNFANGFVNGIRSKINSAASAAAAMASAASKAANDNLVIRSPSRVMFRTGSYFVEGFRNGIVKRTPMAEKAANNMASAAVKATEAVNAAIETQSDYEPVITPVLDLTNIQNGSKNISGMLDTVSGYNMSLQASMDDSTMGYTNLYNEVQMLRSDMKTYTDAVLNRPEYWWQMDGVTINSDEHTRDTFIDLVSDLKRRADMNSGNR